MTNSIGDVAQPEFIEAVTYVGSVQIVVTVEPLDRLTARHRRELDEQVGRVGEILEATPSLTIGPVTVGPHA